MILIQEAEIEVKEYQVVNNYCKIFTDHVDRLYTLALLMTGDHGKAEQCFVAGLEDCVEGNTVFREWAEAWAARTIIKNAIQMISPLRNDPTPTTDAAAEPESRTGALGLAITKLPPLERFVYVMSVLEKYSDRECSILLGCKSQDVVSARIRAFVRLADWIDLGRLDTLDSSASACSAL